jgi:hypothetical protein
VTDKNGRVAGIVEDHAGGAAVRDAEVPAGARQLGVHRPERLAVHVEQEVAVREAARPRALDDLELFPDEHDLMPGPPPRDRKRTWHTDGEDQRGLEL